MSHLKLAWILTTIMFVLLMILMYLSLLMTEEKYIGILLAWFFFCTSEAIFIPAENDS